VDRVEEGVDRVPLPPTPIVPQRIVDVDVCLVDPGNVVRMQVAARLIALEELLLEDGDQREPLLDLSPDALHRRNTDLDLATSLREGTCIAEGKSSVVIEPGMLTDLVEARGKVILREST